MIQTYVAAPHQVRFWRIEQAAGEVADLASRVLGLLPTYGAPLARVEEEVRSAWARHEALRTRLRVPEGMSIPALEVGAGMPMIISETRTEIALVEEGVLTAAFEALRDRVMPARAPYGSALLVAIADDRVAVELACDAGLVDASSLSLVLYEIAGALAGKSPAETIQFSDVAGWLAQGAQPPSGIPGRLALRLQARASRELCGVENLSNSVFRARRAGWLALWAAVLHRFEAPASIEIETNDCLRPEVGAAAGVGAYGAPRALALEVGDELTFSDLAGQVDAVLSTSSLADIASGPARFGFSYAVIAWGEAGGPGEFQLLDISHPLGRQTLSLEIYERAMRLRFRVRYDEAVYCAEQIQNIEDALVALLHEVLERPHRAIGDLPLCATGAAPAVLHGLRRPGSDKTFTELFATAVECSPDAVAVRHEGTVWTYRELDRESERVAAQLLGSGVSGGQVVAVLLSRSPQLLAAALGILKARAIFLPLDVAAPVLRQKTVMADAVVSALLTTRALLSDREQLAATRVLYVEDGPASTAAHSAQPEISPEAAAYILYTSGSTGTPKGVELSHRGFSNYLQYAARRYELATGRGALVQSPVTFDLTFTALFAPLTCGGTVILAPDDSISPGGHVEFVRDQLLAGGLSLLKTTPSYLRLLNGLMPPGKLAGSVHALVLGGEPLLRQDLTRWLTEAPATRLFNEYGPTETVVGSICAEITPARRFPGDDVPIGSPVDNTSIAILDRNGKPLPLGAVGEISIGGDGVAIGYRGREDLTAGRFLNQVLRNRQNTRLYRTGDRGRINPAGEVDFLGRFDDQLKINGVRLEPAEITSILDRDPQVAQSAVVKLPGQHGLDRLIAFVVPVPGRGVARESLNALLASHLAPLYRPHALIVVDSLPMNANGKVDRRALLRLAAEAQPERRPDPVQPRDEREAKLLQIIRDVLSRPDIGIDDNFFDAGGDSIRSIAAVGRATREGFTFSIADLFRRPTVRLLTQTEGTGAILPQVHKQAFDLLRPGDRAKLPGSLEDAYPMSILQLAMIYHNEKDRSAAVYHDIFSYHITFAPDVAALRAAADRLVARHECLRTTFHLAGFEEPLQLVHAEGSSILEVEDISHLDFDAQQRSIAERFEQERNRPFDVTALPLVRLHVYIRDTATVQLTMSFHHSIIDGWSDVTLLTELFKQYHAVLRGEPPPDRLLSRYRDFIQLERAAMADSQCREFWRDKLADLPCPPRSPSARERGQVVVLRVPVETGAAQRLRELCSKHSLPLKSFLLAIHLKVLSLLAGSEDLVTAMVASGRPETPDGSEIVGLFINSVPVRAHIAPGSWLELAQVAKQLEAELLPYRRLPLGEIQAMLGNRAISDTLFYFTHYHIATGLRDIGINLLELVPHEASSFRCVANFWIDPFTAELKISLALDEQSYSPAQRERLAGYYQRATWHLLNETYAPHQAAPLLSEEEAAVASPPLGTEELTTLDEQVRARASVQPETRALIEAGVAISYATLDRRIDAAASRLCELGVATGDRVAICAPRCIDLVIAALATLRCGAVYVPMDPEHPIARAMQILADAGPVLTLATGTALESLAHAAVPATDLVEICADDGSALPFVARSVSSRPAYMFYTSGSTGTPKGVVVSHRAFASFAKAIAPELVRGAPGVWLAVTAPTFDISCLELICTLAYGFTVVLQGPPQSFMAPAGLAGSTGRAPDFSLFFFSSQPGESSYRVLLEAARLADALGFNAVWTPERHFHEFGGPFPNPALTASALAVSTKRIQIRAGSLVLPLHNAIRAAEDWAVVDNLSGGRAGIAIASGWHREDFALAPDAYEQRREIMFSGIDTLRRLWRGDSVQVAGSQGAHEVRIFPRPVRGQLPLWLSAASSPATFEAAAKIGAGVLTHLLSQEPQELAQNIARYRAIAAEKAHVVLMLHAFVGESEAHALRVAADPFKAYLSSSVDLARSTVSEPAVASASDADRDTIVAQSLSRYLDRASLIGGVESCLRRAGQFRDLGVDEIACLVDFGVDDTALLEAIPRLNHVREQLMRSAADRRSIFDNITEHGVTHLQCTPTVLRELITDPRAPAALSRLEVLLVGGEALPQWLAERVKAMGVRRLLNMYGPTEATIWCAMEEVGARPITIGRALDNSALFVLGPDGRPSPFDVPGEIYIGGAGLAEGYWRRPDLDEAAFVRSPLREHDSTIRLYRTGDRGMRLPDGRIQFLGRLDRQVKVAGHRIELAEIERVASSHEAVRDCVALLTDGGQIELAALPAPGPASGEEVREFLQKRLPAAMVPQRVTWLEAFPKTRGGKLDSPRLRALLEEAAEGLRSGKPPRTEVELKIAALWEETLGVPPKDIHDDFFACGGNSLRAMVMVSHLRQAFASEVTVRTLFENPTVCGLAAKLGHLADVPLPAAVLSQRVLGQWPLSPWQERLWLIDRIAPGKAAYNDAAFVEIEGSLDPERVRVVIQAIVDRHDSLRARFDDADGVPHAIYSATAGFELDTVDLRHLGSHAAAANNSVERARAIATRPFDLAAGPLLRVMVALLDDRHSRLLLVSHHIVSDGWSQAILLRELTALYQDLGALPAPPSYAQLFARDRLTGDVARRKQMSSFWARQLADLPPPLELPLDFRRPAAETFLGSVESVLIPESLGDELLHFGQTQRATLFMVLVAGFTVALKRMTGRSDILLGTDVANRAQSGAQNVIGLFVNQIVLRFDLAGGLVFSEHLRRVREVALDAYEHQSHPFNLLVEELCPQRDLGRNPLYQVAFTLQEAPEFNTAGEWRIRAVPIDLGVARLDLEINARRGSQGVVIEASYNSALYRPELIQRLLRGYLLLLEDAVRNPTAAIDSLSFFDASHRTLLLEGFNQTSRPYPATPLVSLIEQHCARSAGKRAITAPDRSLSYGELGTITHRVARGLYAAGVRRGDVTAILSHRGSSLVVAMVSLWRIGAVYLPLDPDQPAARSAGILSEATCTHLVVGPDLGGLADRIVAQTESPLSTYVSLEELLTPPHGVADEQAMTAILYDESDPAYVLFTSGSTGRPKGAIVLHRGMMNHLQAKITDLALTSEDVCLQSAPQTFDISIWQMLAPLAAGGTLVVVDDDTAKSPVDLCEAIEAERISVIELVPTLLELVLSTARNHPRGLQSLRWTISTGEALPVTLCRKWFESFPHVPLMNAYGPTECSDDVTHHVIRTAPADDELYIPIGRPIGNVRLYVVDESLNLAPLGAAGELLVAGVCVGHGYINNPEATSKVFVRDPFDADSGYGAYRTGDLVRRRLDGTLDYLGRIDQQVKLAGCRIELGEIESVLESDSWVRRSVVTLIDTNISGKRLCAYVVPEWAEIEAFLEREEKARRTAEWQSIYNYYYTADAAVAAHVTFDTRGWNDSFTRTAFPQEEMRAWLDQALAKIRALEPRRVLEIGCGTGMLLFALAGECERYAGLDLSAAVVDRLRASLAMNAPQWSHVSVAAAEAHDLSSVAAETFDLVILNSVVQYFPSAAYLMRTLELAAARLAPGGRVFIGDIRSLDLLRPLQTAIKCSTLSPETPLGVLRSEVDKAMAAENELVLSADYFESLQEQPLAGRQVRALLWLKMGESRNELFSYRFDAAIQLDALESCEVHRIEYECGMAERGRLAFLAEQARGGPFMIWGIPNRRLVRDRILADRMSSDPAPATLAELLEGIPADPATHEIDPSLLTRAAAELGYRLQTRISPLSPFRFDALFHREPVVWPVAAGLRAARANNPLRARSASILLDRLRARLLEHLPSFMVPQTIMVLDQFPTNRSGKVARGALPLPELAAPGPKSEDQPRTDAERTLAQIWSELLGVADIGIRANFFALGGDSVLGIQMVARASRRGLRFTPRQIFEHQSIAELAAAAGPMSAERQAEVGPLTGPVPLAPIQCSLLERPLQAPHHWNQAILVSLLAPVDAATLRSLVQALLERHDSLRLRFRRCAQGWLQSYSSAAEIEVEQPLSEAESAAELADRLNASLSLEEGPLFRCGLLATASEPAVLLLVAHHLVIDGISWRVLLDDLGELINAARAGRSARLGRPTASYRQWVERQIALTESRAPREHLPFWLEQASSSARPLFALLPGHQQGSTRREQIKGCKLGPEIAAALSGRLEQQAATTEELLLTGLVLAVSEVFGRRDVVVLKESHGRDAFADLDLSASVGWFTAACPLRLRLPRSGGLKAQIEAVMRQWRMSRGREMSYGILRYLDPDPHVRRSLAEQAPPDVAFNYFGQMGQAQTFGPLRLVQGYSGAVRGPLDSAACPLELNVMLRDGWLEYYWTYDTHRVPEEPLSRLAESFASHLQVVARLFGALAATLEEPDALELSAASTQLIQAAIEELDL